MNEDKRSLKSRAKIKDAFMSLTLQRKREKLSVSGIAAKAEINRSTFYLHYNDVAAVEYEIECDFGNKVCTEIDKFNLADVSGSTYNLFTAVNEILGSNALLEKYILLSVNSEKITSRLKKILTEKVTKIMLSSFHGLNHENAQYCAAYAVAGVVESYVVWARTDGVKQSPEKFFRFVGTMTECIIHSVTFM